MLFVIITSLVMMKMLFIDVAILTYLCLCTHTPLLPTFGEIWFWYQPLFTAVCLPVVPYPRTTRWVGDGHCCTHRPSTDSVLTGLSTTPVTMVSRVLWCWSVQLPRERTTPLLLPWIQHGSKGVVMVTLLAYKQMLQ